jgi:hypothetical protein
MAQPSKHQSPSGANPVRSTNYREGIAGNKEQRHANTEIERAPQAH